MSDFSFALVPETEETRGVPMTPAECHTLCVDTDSDRSARRSPRRIDRTRLIIWFLPPAVGVLLAIIAAVHELWTGALALLLVVLWSVGVRLFWISPAPGTPSNFRSTLSPCRT